MVVRDGAKLVSEKLYALTDRPFGVTLAHMTHKRQECDVTLPVPII
jgi:hypothetical protein